MPTIYDDDTKVDHGNAADEEYRRLADKAGHSGGASQAEKDEFAKLTSPDNYARDGVSGDTGASSAAEGSTSSDSLYKSGQGETGGGFKAKFSGAVSKIKKLSIKVQVLLVLGPVAGVLLVMGFFGLGSLQAIHLAQILALDQTSNITYSEIRTNNMYRYVKSGGNYGETRVSYLGSKIFSKSVGDLRNIGVTFDTNETLGVFKGATIDIDKFPGTKGLDAKAIPTKLAATYGIDKSQITVKGNRAYVKDLGIGASKSLIKDSTANLADGRITYFVKSRQIMKFYSLPTLFHPFRIVDQKITAKITTRQELINARKAQEGRTTYDSSTRAQAYEDFKSSTSGLRAGADAALLIVGSVCMARDAGDAAITYNREAIVVPQAIAAASAQSIGSQQQSGQDFTTEQMDIYNRMMTDPDGKSIYDSQALSAKTNPTDTTGEAMPDKYDQAFSGSGGAKTLKELGGYGGKLACSDVGQAAQIVAGLALLGLSLPSGGTSTVAYGALKAAGGAAAGGAVMVALHELISDSLKDDPIPDSVSAPVRGNLIGYGSRELANINARGSGGVELSAAESRQVDREIAQLDSSEFSSKPLYARLFDAQDHRSVAAKIIDKSGTPQQATRQIATTVQHFGSTMGSLFGSLLPKAHAASTYNYGFNRYGIPSRILNNPDYDDPFANGEKAAQLFDGSKGEDYIKRAKICFGGTIAKDEQGLWGYTPEKDVNPLSEDYESGNCNQSTDKNWDRTIVFVNDSSNIEAAACYQGEQDSCDKFAISSGPQSCSTDPAAATVSISGLPSWAKMPVSSVEPGGAVSGNVKMAIANIKEGGNVAPSLKVIVQNNPDFILLNEVAETSIASLKKAAAGYDATRSDFDDGTSQSLNNALMWNKSKWELLDSGTVKIVDHDLTFAEGKSPRDWNRYAVWGIFKRSDGAIVPVIVTHQMTNPVKFPDQHGNPPQTRVEQYSQGMDILLQLTKNLSQYGPVLVGGDMNSQPDQGDWSAVPKMKSAGYDFFQSDVIYGFWPQGTQAADKKVVPIPIGSDHGGNSIFVNVAMNGAGPNADGATTPSTTPTSSTDCPTPNDDGTVVDGEATMQDDYAKECSKYTGCTGQCVDFVKFRLKKNIDASKFDDFTTGTGGVAAYTSSENLGKQYGYKVDNTPAVNAVASWPAGGVPGSHANDTYGHVAMVSKVTADYIIVEEYNATTPAETYGTRKIPMNVARLLTYAHTERDF
jgi:surface antigen/endonuclease/exonuclease/phosphatase (EEP) superfamily protein YafD